MPNFITASRLLAFIIVPAFFGVTLAPRAAAAAAGSLIDLDDLAAMRAVEDPQLSPDGAWVAYTVRSIDVAADKRVAAVWMTSWDGRTSLRLTTGGDGDWQPRFSPDGRRIAFLSNRGPDHDTDQLWLLDRVGGEAAAIVNFKGGVADYAWSPDSRRLAVIARDDDPDRGAGKDGQKADKPIVIDRFYFKEDETGYLRDRRQHLYIVDIAGGAIEPLTLGRYDEQYPSWSPDGSQLAFVSKRFDDPDRNETFGLYVIEAHAGATPRLVTQFQGESGDSEWMSAAAWSPDGRTLAFTAGGDPKLVWYAVHALSTVPAAGGPQRVLTAALDRNVTQPRWSGDGHSLYFLLEDDRNQHLARIATSGGAVTRPLGGRRVVSAFTLAPHDRIAVLDATPERPAEVAALEARETRALTHQNDTWLAARRLGAVEEIEATSRDSTRVSGFVVKPPDYVPGRRYPTLLRIHGGPTSQYANEFSFDWQLFAAHGYVVVAGNPRGSSGRGEDYAKAIYADWGNKDGDDVLALTDLAVSTGLADPQRLGIGGWSYGGILTNAVIARDTRFRAATSGAGMGNALAGYGTDMYVRGWEAELGVPWRNLEPWLRNSSPFLHADRIVTPTLFLCGDRDFNVPLLNSEQMYQALRSLGRDTRLVIYPGAFHGLRRPSHLRDRLARYLDWYDRHLAVRDAAP